MQSTWLAIIASGACFFILITVVRTKVRYSSVFLSLFGPFTDHWIWIQGGASKFNRLFMLWGILSYSVTVLYGGGLASSLAVLKPPSYPTSLNDLGNVHSQLISISLILSNSDKDKFISRYANRLSNQIGHLDESKNSKHRVGQIERLAQLVGELQKGFCLPKMRVYNRSNAEYPFLCLDKPYITKHETPITLIDYGRSYLLQRFAFQDSSTYMLSPSFRMQDQQESMSLLLRKNYFAKLVLPIASSWMESGHMALTKGIITHMSTWLTQNPKLPYSFKDSEPSEVVQFTPWKLGSHKSVLVLTTFFLCIAIVVFLSERVSESNFIFCVSRKDLTQQQRMTTLVAAFINEADVL